MLLHYVVIHKAPSIDEYTNYTASVSTMYDIILHSYTPTLSYTMRTMNPKP